MLRRFLQPETAFFVLIWGVFLFVFQERAFYDPGSLWHIKVGELIVDRGFMHTDPFTYTYEGRTWIPQQWGAEVLMALAHRVAGLDALLLGFATLIAGLYTWIFARMRRAGMHPILAAVLTGGFLFAGAFHYFARPHMSTIVFMGWTMACLVDFDRGRATAARLAGLIPLYIVWTNLHGGALGGVFTLGLAVAGWGLLFLGKDKLKPICGDGLGTPIQNWRQLGLLIGIVASCALTPFDNPFGMEMIHTWKRIVGSDVLKQVVAEHKPLNLANSPDQVIFGLAIAYLLLLAGTFPRWPRVTWLIPLVWFALTFKGIRQGPLFAVTAAVVVADLWPHTIWHRLLKKYGDTVIQDPPDLHAGKGWRPYAIPTLAVLAALVLQVCNVSVPLVGRGWARLDPAFAPFQMTKAIQEYRQTHGPDARIYNDANWGGYMIYYHPGMKIFMDDRFELYGDTWTADYVDMIWHHPERIESVMDKYNLELALIVTGPEKTQLDHYLSNNNHWTELERTETAVLFRRLKP